MGKCVGLGVVSGGVAVGDGMGPAFGMMNKDSEMLELYVFYGTNSFLRASLVVMY